MIQAAARRKKEKEERKNERKKLTKTKNKKEAIPFLNLHRISIPACGTIVGNPAVGHKFQKKYLNNN